MRIDNDLNTSHFGKNPVNGGRPLIESRRNGISSWSDGDLIMILFIEFLLVEFLINRIKKNGMIIIEYKMK